MERDQMKAGDLVQDNPIARYMAVARQVASALGGALVMFGVITATQNTDALKTVTDIGNALTSILIALGALAPIYGAVTSYFRSSNKTAVERVQAMPIAVQAQALAERSPVVEKVLVSDPAVAAAAPSPKVVATNM